MLQIELENARDFKTVYQFWPERDPVFFRSVNILVSWWEFCISNAIEANFISLMARRPKATVGSKIFRITFQHAYKRRGCHKLNNIGTQGHEMVTVLNKMLETSGNPELSRGQHLIKGNFHFVILRGRKWLKNRYDALNTN